MKEKQSIMNQKLSILAFLLLISSSCLAQGAEQIIRQNISAFSKALVDRNYDALVAAYCDDAKIFPNGTNILAGSESIRTYWTPSEDASSITVYHKIIPEEITIVGSTAYDYGYYEGRSRNADGSEVPWRGKYVVVWKEVKPGEWKIYMDIWNRSPNE